jgi:probable Rubsico expression protein CbbX
MSSPEFQMVREPPGGDAADALPADASLREVIDASGIDEVLSELDRELIALAPVKSRLREIAALLVIDRLREAAGLTSQRPSLHMCFTGNPGTGKTTVAMRMAEILHRLGYLETNQLVTVTRDDLVGQYVGHTAPKTKDVLQRARGGVLLIDEAYYLHRPDNERDYGQEAIEILLQVMEDWRDDLVVILAGYKDRMDEFFASNPGMGSRVAHHIDFPDYSVDELLQIGDLMLAGQSYRLSPEAERAFREYVERRRQLPRFAHGRSIRNALDRARLRHASRLVRRGDEITRDELMTLEPADIYGSSVFEADIAEDESAAAERTRTSVAPT